MQAGDFVTHGATGVGPVERTGNAGRRDDLLNDERCVGRTLASLKGDGGRVLDAIVFVAVEHLVDDRDVLDRDAQSEGGDDAAMLLGPVRMHLGTPHDGQRPPSEGFGVEHAVVRAAPLGARDGSRTSMALAHGEVP